MKIYFTASVSAGREYVDNYFLIVNLIGKFGHEVLSSHVAERSITRKGEQLSMKAIFEREHARLKEADLVVAEVTKPSFGVGYLVSQALILNKAVLALFYKDSENLLSPMIAGNPEKNLYDENYSEDTLEVILKNFFHFIEKRNSLKGSLVVIEGLDGSGKRTQLELLEQKLKKKGYNVRTIDFPRYYSSFHGVMVGEYLKGKFGDVFEVNPYLASLTYALDRLGAKEEMEEWLSQGCIVLANRYSTSNMAHQAAKLTGESQRIFLEWLDQLEYRIHKIPREDLVIFLHVPRKVADKLIKTKKKRRYLNGNKEDIHERNAAFLKASEEMYLKLAKENKHWATIKCVTKGGKMKTKETINKEICSVLKEHNIVPIC